MIVRDWLRFCLNDGFHRVFKVEILFLQSVVKYGQNQLLLLANLNPIFAYIHFFQPWVDGTQHFLCKT